MVRVERERVSDVQQLGFRQSDQRPSKQCAERQSVASIGQGPRQGNSGLYLLPAEEAFARLRRDTDALALQSLLELPELSSDRGQQGDISQSARPHFPISSSNELIANEWAAQLGYAFRLRVTDRLGHRVLAVGDVQRGDGDQARLCLNRSATTG